MRAGLLITYTLRGEGERESVYADKWTYNILLCIQRLDNDSSFCGFGDNFAESFGGTVCNILPPPWAISLLKKHISWEITYSTELSSPKFSYLAKFVQLQFFPKCGKLWQNFWKIQFLGRIFCETFPWNIDETWGSKLTKTWRNVSYSEDQKLHNLDLEFKSFWSFTISGLTWFNHICNDLRRNVFFYYFKFLM